MNTDQYHDSTELGLFHKILFFQFTLVLPMNYSKWFTLIEMLIVIVIISIMLSITLNLSANQTKALRFKIAREAFVGNYNNYIITTITTNSNNSILLFQWDTISTQQPPIALSGNTNNLILEDMASLQLATLDTTTVATNIWSRELSFDPTSWKCVMNSRPWWSDPEYIKFTLKDRNSTIAGICYSIALSTCKIKQISCS